jgi:hypothetical protein
VTTWTLLSGPTETLSGPTWTLSAAHLDVKGTDLGQGLALPIKYAALMLSVLS